MSADEERIRLLWEETLAKLRAMKAAEQRVAELEDALATTAEALAAAADTFADLRTALHLIGHPTSAWACEIAENGTREALADPRVRAALEKKKTT